MPGDSITQDSRSNPSNQSSAGRTNDTVKIDTSECSPPSLLGSTDASPSGESTSPGPCPPSVPNNVSEPTAPSRSSTSSRYLTLNVAYMAAKRKSECTCPLGPGDIKSYGCTARSDETIIRGHDSERCAECKNWVGCDAPDSHQRK